MIQFYLSLFRSREIQLDDLRKDLDHLNNVYKNATNANYQLNDDLTDITRQIEKLTLQNQEVIEIRILIESTLFRLWINSKNLVRRMNESEACLTAGTRSLISSLCLRASSDSLQDLEEEQDLQREDVSDPQPDVRDLHKEALDLDNKEDTKGFTFHKNTNSSELWGHSFIYHIRNKFYLNKSESNILRSWGHMNL